jgi:hypothetical protein
LEVQACMERQLNSTGLHGVVSQNIKVSINKVIVLSRYLKFFYKPNCFFLNGVEPKLLKCRKNSKLRKKRINFFRHLQTRQA